MLGKQTFDSNQKQERTIPGIYMVTPAARENADTWEGRSAEAHISLRML